MFSQLFINRLGVLLGVLCFLSLFATATLAQDSRGLLDKASQQIDAGDYISAKETLEQIKTAQLSPADQTRVSYLRVKADHALEKATATRRSIDQADQLAKQKDFVAARQVLEDAQKSAHRDSGTQSRIKAKLAEIEARRKQSAQQMKDLFHSSVADYKAGRLDQADKGFKTVVNSGVDLGFWNRGKPQQYIKKIAEKRALLPTQPVLQKTPQKDIVVIEPAPRDEEDEELEPIVEVSPPSEFGPVVVKPEPAQVPSYVATPAAGETLIDTEVRRRRIITGQITFQHKIAIDRAEDLVRQHKFAEARRVVHEAQDALATNQSILPTEKMAQMHRDGQAKLAYIDKSERAYQVAQAEEQRIRAQATAQQASARANQQREERVKQLFSQGTSFIQERKYQQALDRYIQVLSIDPHNPDARKLSSWLRDQVWVLENQDIEASAETEYQGAIRNIREASIPFDHDPGVTWDKNWEALTKRRLDDYSGVAQDSPENIEALRLMDVRHPRFEYQDTPLSEVFDDLRVKSGLNIVPNWQSLMAAGIEQDKPISLQLHNVTFKRALKAILSSLSSAGFYATTVSYAVEDGVIVIATSESLDAELDMHIYEISDLLMAIRDNRGGPQFEAGGLDIATGSSSSGKSVSKASTVDVTKLQGELITDILDFIKRVEPDSWQDGGGSGTASILGTKLLIYQTAAIHVKIREMLKQIRATRPIQISVEPRFIYVTDNFLEDIGMDFDVTITEQGSFDDIVIAQNSFANAATANTGAIGSFGGNPAALAVQGSYLDNVEVDFFIRATQASRQATTLMAPRVTFENASSANIYIGRIVTFIDTVETETTITDTNPPLMYTEVEIETGEISTGPTLNVGGVVSPDRRFVRLDVEIILHDLFSLPSVSDLFPGILDPDSPSAAIGIQQLPQIDTTTITTQVSVPDGGALLIGGLRRRTEEKKESGVPILNKIPWIKRFFSNASLVDDKTVLIILLRPRIIDLKEEQGITYPALGER